MKKDTGPLLLLAIGAVTGGIFSLIIFTDLLEVGIAPLSFLHVLEGGLGSFLGGFLPATAAVSLFWLQRKMDRNDARRKALNSIKSSLITANRHIYTCQHIKFDERLLTFNEINKEHLRKDGIRLARTIIDVSEWHMRHLRMSFAAVSAIFYDDPYAQSHTNTIADIKSSISNSIDQFKNIQEDANQCIKYHRGTNVDDVIFNFNRAYMMVSLPSDLIKMTLSDIEAFEL
ncbi:hypothetical protein [Thalassospira lucentensis]|uniref:hypothetical protein n=1 Tax=Thalassospira lucentensis TaxID=168935 RepID=UPI003AA7B9CD